jgi:hypothetical protein
MRRKKIKESISIKRHMQTYAELEDGSLIEYSFYPSHEDEYGSYMDDSSYQWLIVQKDLEAKHGQKIVASVARICERISKYETHSKGDNVTIHTTTDTDTKELIYRRTNVRIENARQTAHAFPSTFNPDMAFCWEKSYMHHFNLVKTGWGKDTKFITKGKEENA